MLRSLIKYHLIEKNEYIKESYESYAQKYMDKKFFNLLKRGRKILKLNYHVYMQKNEDIIKKNEFGVPVGKLVDILAEYDTISFDIFDTMIFRAFDHPTDVFLYLETKYDVPNFQSLRKEAEKEARNKSKNGEITISDIYNVLEKQCNFKASEWINREIEAEKQICFANPYIQEVFFKLKEKGKRLIATSDMYLSSDILSDILIRSGYDGISQIYVSCDIQKSKASGELYSYIKKKLNPGRIIHVGDNQWSDVKQANEMGWESYYYPNVNKDRYMYPANMSTLVGGLYRGLSNAYLKCGFYQYDDYFEYGFLNGGLLVYGYCQWINKLAKDKKIEQILFVARDGYIMEKVYKQYFNEIPSSYVLFSRFCAEQITFERYTRKYIDQTLGNRCKKASKMTIEHAFSEIGLEFLISYLEEEHIDRNMLLDDNIYDRIVEFIYKHKDEIVGEFEKLQEQTYEYYRDIIKGCKKILIVDVGWFGSCAVALDYLLREKHDPNLKVFSALIGGTSDVAVDARIQSGKLSPYVFSNFDNVDILKSHMDKQLIVHNLLVEILFTEMKPSFLKFREIAGSIVPEFGYEEYDNYKAIDSMQKGMLQFAEELDRFKNLMDNLEGISGHDAYAPLQSMMKKRKQCYHIFKNYKVSQLSGKFSESGIQTIGELMKESKYVK